MSRKFTEKEVNERIKEKHDNTIVMSNYTTTNAYANFECLICGYKWSTKPTYIINRGDGCYKCAHKRIGLLESLNEEEIRERIKTQHGEDIKLIIYGGTTHSKSTFQCARCGNVWNSTAHNVFIQKYACKKCWYIEIGRLKSGHNSNWWKNGITLLRPFIKSCLDEWKKKSMIACNYNCVIHNNHRFDEIHHLYPLNNIIKDALIELNLGEEEFIGDYPEEKIKLIINKVKEIHEKWPLGACLCRDSHKLFHLIYGRNNCVPQDFYEFQHKISIGEIQI